MSKNNLKKFKVEFAIAAAVLMLLTYILMKRPVTGVADNGDFARIMNSTGLYYLTNGPTDHYFGYVNRLYGIGYVMPFGGKYLSTELSLVLSAIFLSKSISGSALFDIRFLGTLYLLIFAAAVFFVMRYSRIRAGYWGMAAALSGIIIFCDIGYTSYFNSLYGEPVTLVFLLLMAGMALALATEEKPAVWMLILFILGAFFFAGAKVQNSPAGLLAALLIIRLALFRKDQIWRITSMIAAMSVVAVSLACYASVSKDIKICNKYQSVFYGILKGSPDPAGDLEELGLDPSLAVLAGTNYFMESYPVDIKAPEFKEMLYDKISHTKVVGFYIRHPQRLLQKLEIAAENGFQLKQGFGNYEKYPGIQYKQTSNIFGLWSDFKMKVLPHTLLFTCIFFITSWMVLFMEYARAGNARTRFFIEFMGFIALMGVTQFILPILGDGEADLSKHLYLFNICFDLLSAAGVMYIAQKAAIILLYFKSRRLAARLQTD